jgi:hypothetical protein
MRYGIQKDGQVGMGTQKVLLSTREKLGQCVRQGT